MNIQNNTVTKDGDTLARIVRVEGYARPYVISASELAPTVKGSINKALKDQGEGEKADFVTEEEFASKFPPISDEQSEPKQDAPTGETPAPAPQPNSSAPGADGGAPGTTQEAGSPAGDTVPDEVPDVIVKCGLEYPLSILKTAYEKAGDDEINKLASLDMAIEILEKACTPEPSDILDNDPEPTQDPEAGDKTPAYVEWYRRNHSEADFHKKYGHRKGGVIQ